MNYKTVIGLEIHAELKTKTKLFCGCAVEFDAAANSRVCPVCCGMPGALPVLNSEAVDLAIRAGLALGCKIEKFSMFDRKNYFYPDLPKAYQITQFFKPICTNGGMKINDRFYEIERIHIEEDAGKLIHNKSSKFTLVDYNRASVPLIEIVTAPVFNSGKQAKRFLQLVNLTLKYAGVCSGKMEQGALRCDVNISVMPYYSSVLGTRTEIKNLNSYRAVESAIEKESKRQIDILENGGKIKRQTLKYDNNTDTITVLREKEGVRDYRYFKDPDLPPLVITQQQTDSQQKLLPELPLEKMQRYESEYGLNSATADIIVSNPDMADFFEQSLTYYHEPKIISDIITVDLINRTKRQGNKAANIKISPEDIAKICKMIRENRISRNSAKVLLRILFECGGDPEQTAKSNNLIMKSGTSAVNDAINAVLKQNPKALVQYRSGCEKVFGFFMGQVCRKIGGSANPAIIKEALEKALKD